MSRCFRIPRLPGWLALAGWLAACGAAGAADGGPDVAAEPHFAIRALRVDGATLVPPEELRAALLPFLGPQRTLDDLRAAVAAVEHAYQQRGFRMVKVVLPEQDSSNGQFRLQVVEARLGSLRVEGATQHDEANVRATLPGLLAGSAPNLARVDRALALANENPSKQTALTLRPGANPGEVDAVARVSDQAPLRGVLSLDNTGTAQTGYYRTGVAVQHANLGGRDQVFSAQYITAPERPGDVQIVALAYHIPLYGLGDALEFGYTYSNVNSGQVNTGAGSYAVSGSGGNWLASYVHHFDVAGDLRRQLSLSLEQHDFRSQVRFGGVGPSQVPDVSSRPLTLTYSVELRRSDLQGHAYLGVSRNLPGNPRDNDDQYRLARSDPAGTGPDSAFTIWRWGADVLHPLGQDWFLQAAANGTWTRDMLINGEQFGLGGAASVRGFDERALANDYGARASLELRAPDLGPRTGVARLGLRPLAFVEGGHLWRNDPLAGEAGNTGIASAGVGMRGNLGPRLNFSLDLGWVIDPGANQQRGDTRAHLGVSWQF